MLQTPFVALSATVGNPQQFLDFLNAVQRAQGRKVKLIECVYVCRRGWENYSFLFLVDFVSSFYG